MKKDDFYQVIGKTEVHIPSHEFPEVPYFVYLLKNEKGKRIVWRNLREFSIDERITIQGNTVENIFEHIGIIGAGITGCGIAAAALIHGCEVTIYVRNIQNIQSIRQKIYKNVLSLVGKEHADTLIKKLYITSSLKDFKSIPFIIEAISEHSKEKIALYKSLEPLISKKAIIATNTSSLPIDSLAKSFRKPSRFISMHFFNPVTKMKLVEITITDQTSKSTQQMTQQFAKQLEKQCIILKKGSNGFIVNRLLFTFLAEALVMEQEGIATKEDIDKAMELGLNHPMGPFKLMDFIGLDTSLSIINSLFSKNKKNIRFDSLEKLVDKQMLGKKTGLGFYNYKK